MRTNKRFLSVLFIVLAFSLVLTGPVFASSGFSPSLDDEVVFFGTYRLDSGDRLEGNLIVFGGVITLEELQKFAASRP